MSLDVADFDYELPPDRVAQQPTAQRERSRLMVLDPSGRIDHRRFEDLVELLRPGDLLVLNDTRVLPARLIGRKASGGRVELLLVEWLEGEVEAQTWSCLVRASRPPREGEALVFGEDLRGRVARVGDGMCRVALRAGSGGVRDVIERVGRVPLPPYIRRTQECGEGRDDDRARYQTVYARQEGAVAAPTAGLHFTLELLDRLRRRGVDHTTLTLHVGPGTFQPVRSRRVEDHRMHEERYLLPQKAVGAVERTKEKGGRIVAVGTTVARTLEHCAVNAGDLRAGSGRCDLFIYPGYRFRIVDDLITNFHLPRSTLLMLVSALTGIETLLGAYREAVRRGYRFYSYGDAMLVRSAR